MAQQTLCTKSPSGNEKIANKGSKLMWATYRATTKDTTDLGAPINGTCPKECPLLKVCYANLGMVNIQQGASKKRNDNVADWIKGLPQGAKVRHLVSGDLFLNNEVDRDYIKEAKAGHKARPDVKGYAYTHGHKRLNPKTLNSLDNFTVNASCDSETQIKNALDKGWDAVTIVPEDTPKVTYTENYKMVVCPNQTVGITCESCMLCAKKNRKDSNGLPIVIGFKAHSIKKRHVLELLESEA